MKELSKSVNSWWSYRKKFDRTFFSETQCSLIVCRRRQSFEDESKLVTAERPFWLTGIVQARAQASYIQMLMLPDNAGAGMQSMNLNNNRFSWKQLFH